MDKGPASRLAPRSERPAPLPLLFVALGLWSGAAAAYQYAAGLSPGVLWCILAAGLALAGVGIGVYAKAGGAKAEVVSLVALGLGLGLACGSFAGLSAQARAESLQGQAAATYRFEIVEDVHDGSFSRTARARTVLDDGRVFSVRLVFKGKDSDVAFGDCIDATTTLRPPSAGAAGFYWQQGIDAVADVRAFEARERDDPLGVLVGVRKAAIALVEEQEAPGGALLTAILMGERSALNASGLYADIRVVGLAHLVAVSGAHLVIVGSFLASLLRLARVPRVAALVIQVLFIGIYLVFTGMQVSALRAACMTVVATLSFFARRRASSMNALAVCIIAMVVASPATSVSISFVLSAGSTLSIVVLGRLFSNWFSSTVPRAPAIVRENASLCLASSVVVMPLTAALFSQMSLISPVANIVAAPLFAFLCTGGLVAVCLSLALPSLAGVLLAPLLGASQGFCEMVSLIARVPYAAIPAHAGVVPAVLLSLALFFALWYAWPRPSKAGALGASLGLAALALAAVAATPFLSSDELVMLNVGQGDAFLVKSRGSCVLVDTGMNDRQLLSGLARHSAYTIDTVVITHPDYDHMGSLDALCGIVRVKRVCLAEPLFTCGCESCEDLLASAAALVGEEGLVPLQVGDDIRFGSICLTTVWPEGFSDKGGNADSLCLLLEREGRETWKALLCGDLEAKQMNQLLDTGRVGEVDILKVGHHGARVALDEKSAGRLSPRIALISVGANNSYGHPSPEALDLLEGLSCTVVRSDEAGDVVCKFTDGGIGVRVLG